jgi:hypothetical protein
VGAQLRQHAGNVSIVAKDCQGIALEPLVEALNLRLASEQARVDGLLDPTRGQPLDQDWIERESG